MPADSSSSNPDSNSLTGVPLLAGVTLSSPFFLAPVAGYSDAAFRSVCYELGAALCYTEMVSAEALVRNHPKTKLLLERSEEERLFAIQLFGAKPETLGKAARIVSELRPLVIDLNCGCPVPKIVRSGAGSALLKDPQKLHDIVRAMRESTDVPVTVKIRKGWDEDAINFKETADAAVSGGAIAITLHGRTKTQGYSGTADWESIRALTGFLDGRGIPVFGSGDVFEASAALRMLSETACAGVMIARGAMGNPFIFAEALALFAKAPKPQFSKSEIASIARRHLLRSVSFLGEKTACLEFRKHFCAYSKGKTDGASLRNRAVHCSSVAEFDLVFKDLV
jgi:nifR3 family TIM-barrel protein